MEIPSVDYSADFVNFWSASFPDRKCPPLPTKPDQLGLDAVIAMKERSPHLYQNLFKPDPSTLPADVMLRYKENRLWAEDLQAIEEAGFAGTAKNMRVQIEEANQIILQKRIEESAARNAAIEKKRQEEGNLSGWQKMMTRERTYEEIEAAKRQFGVTGEPIF